MFEVQFSIPRTQLIAVEIILENLGAISIVLKDAENNPVFIEGVNETPIWESVSVSASFEQESTLSHLQSEIEKVIATPIEISTRCIDNINYLESWKTDFSPMKFGERLWVCPSWFNYPDPFAINIRLDPGLAFGTGTHPTTALCMEWLATHSLVGQSMIDFGCGSGILAIAAYFLGAKHILAIDHDPQATLATYNSAKYNSVPEEHLSISTTDKLIDQNCDLLIANILLNPLLTLEKQIAQCIKPTGKIVLSGILEQQGEKLMQIYKEDFSIDKIITKNGWLLVEASPK